MNELLTALGICGRTARKVAALAIWFGFGASTVAAASALAVLEWYLNVGLAGTVSVVAITWLLWTVWHSLVFPRNRQRWLRESTLLPYRRAFLVDLIPGLTVSFAQMLRPAINGPNIRAGESALLPVGTPLLNLRAAAGGVVAVGATVLFIKAWRTLGSARVGFVPEYVGTAAFQPLREGPYAHVRHPLFWSGIFFSCGLAVAVGTATAIAVAAANVLYGLVYNVLEDRRLRLVFGECYASYARSVPHIIPVGLAGRQRLMSAPLVAAYHDNPAKEG
ncbi:protein-S-isoprenylcysteine O-methyltransferase Ste14 [Geodermatophilus bullaregiensis]|uniref:methyltransferase family protein n=1 Tax=Geodermatophilus bullaregiensis TaxID=1564160 RepID=UPI00195D8FC9|nr:methyltransferase [Geodermatophilus bullaregiensis]MBM7808051.1 protein-S-isoprenylcysteine O-methyltransferase Ste14 [Geodermatophilus bullaregiensis]